jgi:polar amino acid transport system substrate-binding protein
MRKIHVLIFCLSLLFCGCTHHNNTNTDGFATIDDLKHARIATLMGSIHDAHVTEHFPQATILRLDNESDLFVAMDNGKADAAMLTELFYRMEAESTGKYKELGTLLYVDVGIGFSLAQTDIRDQFNAFLSELKEDGTFDQLVEKWMGKEHPSARMPEWNTIPKGVPLKVGFIGSASGYGFIRDNKPAGLEVELLIRFGNSIGRPIEFLTINFGGLIAALTSGQVDIIASGIAITPERSKQVAFSIPYLKENAIVVTRAALASKENLIPQSVAQKDGSDLATAIVATMTGTNSEFFLRENFPQAQLLLFDDINDAFLAVKTGKADYVLTSYTTSLLAEKNNRELVVLPKEYIREPAGIAMNKKDTALLRQINEVIIRFKNDNKLEEIISHWIKTDGSDYQFAEIPTIKEGKPLRVGIAANREPMCFISNGKITGIDAEIIENIAFELGRPVEYSDMKFSALIAALESGRIDVIISNFSITSERLKRVNFSEGYFVNPQVLTTLSYKTEEKSERLSWFAEVKERFFNNLILEKRYLLIFEGFKQTIIITIFAIILGTIFGGIICFLRMSRNKAMRNFAKMYIMVMRGTPILVLLMIFFYIIFASTSLSATVVAVITFALNMGAYSSEMFRTAIQSVDKGQTEAGIALGFTKIQTFIFVVFPQALKNVIPVYKGEVISLLKMTSIVGYIAVVDLTKASDIIRSRTFDAFFPLIAVAIIYFLLAWLLGMALNKLDRKISSKK